MSTAFEDCFGSYLSASADYRLYQQAKGYREEGYSAYWEPQDPCELEPIEPSHGPGAMSVGELSDYDCSDVEEFWDEPDNHPISPSGCRAAGLCIQ